MKKLTEEEIERIQIETVFSLGGGELESEKWNGHRFWFEGAPEWIERYEIEILERVACKACKGTGFIDCPGCGGGLSDTCPTCDLNGEIECPMCSGEGGFDFEVRTLLAWEIFGQVTTPKGWTRKQAFRSSGERGCGWCGPGTDWDGSDKQELARMKEPNTNTCYRGDPDCPICEGGGHVYIGDGWQEIIFTRPMVFEN